MKLQLKIIMAFGLAMILSSCMGLQDSEGWKDIQKNEFSQILKSDKYASVCNDTKLYNWALESKNSRLMSKMLIAYAHNLANGCIDLVTFEQSQKAKKARDIDTHYKTYMQDVNEEEMMLKLRAGVSIEEILKPYIPDNPQFERLLKLYRQDPNNSRLSRKQFQKIRLNIERVKLMKDKLGTNYALINIPQYVVRIIENNQTALKFAVVVGKTNMQTPVFAAPMKYVMINPQWSIPDSIARKSIIPHMLANPSYLKARGIVIRKSYDLNSAKVDRRSVNWKPYVKGEGYVPYKFIQKASVKNGLGRVKFIFPNKFAVYMHDTLSKSLFKRQVRTFSHGCIRLAKPVSLLHHITTNYTNSDIETVTKQYDSLKTNHLKLTKPMMVHTAYLTMYVSDDGLLHTYRDVYGFDKTQNLNF